MADIYATITHTAGVADDSALELVTYCRCREGCPACVGPPGEIGPETKHVTKQLLQHILSGPE